MRLLKKALLLGAAAAFVLAPLSASADLIISEVVDATLPGGLPKFVELTNTGPGPVVLSDYSLGNYNNGGSNLGGGAAYVLPTGITLPACESYVLSFENGDSPGVGLFFDVYGFDPDNFDQGAFINGDDVVALFLGAATGDGSDATIVDILGVVGEAGGSSWEYTDSYCYRNSDVSSSNATYTAAEWTCAGPNGLETGDDVEEEALILDETSPGEHLVDDCTSVPVENKTWGQIKSLY